MTYRVLFTKQALSALKKLDRSVSRTILAWIRKNLDGCDNPRSHGKALRGELSGQWRYRVGDYRLLCLIEDDEIVVLVLRIGHRREIYR